MIAERLGDAVDALSFARDALLAPVLSPAHMRAFAEQHIGPLNALVARLEREAPDELLALRTELEALAASYFAENAVRHDFLMSRATKR